MAIVYAALIHTLCSLLRLNRILSTSSRRSYTTSVGNSILPSKDTAAKRITTITEVP